jgi:hypothetical protein
MDIISILKKAGVSALVILLGFLAVTAFFSPLLNGKEIIQQDIDSNRMLAKETMDYRDKQHEEPLWNSRIFGGMPTYQLSQVNPGNWVAMFNNGLVRTLWVQIGHMFLMFVGMYILLMVLKLNPWVAAAGALAYTFGTYFYTAIEAGHNSKLNTMAYVAPLIGAMILTYRGKLLGGLGLAALFTAFVVGNNHYQVAYYAGILIGVLGLVELVAVFLPAKTANQDMKPLNKRLITFGLASLGLLVAAGLGAATDTARLWESAEYSKWSIRGGKSELTAPPESASKSEKEEYPSKPGGVSYSYLVQWSYGIDETFTLLIPNFKGGGSRINFGTNSAMYDYAYERNHNKKDSEDFAKQGPGYWGTQPGTSGPIYAGAIICYLFLLGLFLVPGRYKWWSLAAVVITVPISWGGNIGWLTRFLYYNFPLYNKFRAPTMILMFTCLVMTMLAMMTVQRVITMTPEERKKWFKPILIISGIPVLILLFFAIAGSSLYSFESPSDKRMFEGADPALVDAIISDRIRLFRMDALRSLFFVLLGGVALLLPFMMPKTKIPAFAMGILFLVLCGLDLVPVAGRYINSDSYRKKMSIDRRYPMSEAEQTIQQFEKDVHFRVLNNNGNNFNDPRTSLYNKSVGGYHPIKSRRYQEMFDSLVTNPRGNPMEIYRMMNTKWVIQSPRDGKGQPQAVQFPEPCGNAWFVDTYVVTANADEEIKLMRTFKSDSVAIIPKAYEAHVQGLRITPDSMASIRLTSFSPKELAYESSASSEQLAVFSEIHYQPGWNAFIDGKPTDHIRADYVLRAMKVPAGKHKIEFRFEPDAFYKGNTYSFIASAVLLLVLLAVLGLGIYKFIKKGDATENGAKKAIA